MKQFNRIYLLAILMVFVLAAMVSCSGNAKTLDYYGAVEKVTSSATQLTISEYYSLGIQITLEKGSPEFNTILGYLGNSEVTREQPRFVESNGETVEVGIPYVRNYTLLFTLSDGSEITFDCGTQIWFNTEDMIYSASVDAALLEEVLFQLIPCPSD